MNDIDMVGRELCGLSLELINQLVLLKKIIKNDIDTLRELGKDEAHLVIFESHAFHLDSVLTTHLKRIIELFKFQEDDLNYVR